MSPSLDKSVWKRVAFGDVVTNRNVTVKDPEAAGIDRVIAMEHLDPGELRISRWGSIDDGTSFTRRVQPGQTLFGKRRAYQRKAAYAEFDAITSGDILVFEADPDRLLPEFLPFVVQSDGFYDHALGTSAGSLSPRTNWRDLANYEFDLPPLDEQQRVADLLWAIERHRHNLVERREALASGADLWLSARIADYPRTPLGSVIALQHGRPVPSTLYGKGDFPLLRPGDMKPSGQVAWSESTVRIPQEFVDNFPGWVVEQGDLVINMTAQSLDDRFLGRVCRMHSAALLNQRIGRLRPSGVARDFVYVALRAAEFTDWVARKSEGSKVKHMHWRHIEDYPLPIPDKAVQIEIVGEYVRWQRAIEKNENALAALLLLSETVSRETFGGDV